ncbi:hypothetical protein L596_024860 [Steinernema carpocapsae]|uniref:Uncharacterized protein n=1 Tax=Steinernema carpocapsae TaxID=34508 RepID=A0A4U5M614_STECR|nr:hypothetical protein L596_024860 [Steinernema carpocapsae]
MERLQRPVPVPAPEQNDASHDQQDTIVQPCRTKTKCPDDQTYRTETKPYNIYSWGQSDNCKNLTDLRFQ